MLRRELADLNRQFLEISLATERAADPRFAWSDAVRCGLLATDEATRERMASSPFTFFELVLPAGTTATPSLGRVEDARRPASEPAESGRCLTFLHLALFLAWRLADSAPLAMRLALGISPTAELFLNETSASQLVRFAASPGLIRPRWPDHRRYWELLASAARRGSDAALQWAHWAGICLLGSEQVPHAAGGSTSGPQRRPGR
jgi:hypothetical protein